MSILVHTPKYSFKLYPKPPSQCGPLSSGERGTLGALEEFFPKVTQPVKYSGVLPTVLYIAAQK